MSGNESVVWLLTERLLVVTAAAAATAGVFECCLEQCGHSSVERREVIPLLESRSLKNCGSFAKRVKTNQLSLFHLVKVQTKFMDTTQTRIFLNSFRVKGFQISKLNILLRN